MKPQAVAIGCSLGGFHALRAILAELDARIVQPLLVCLHTSGNVGTTCELLAAHSRLPVIEAVERQPPAPGTVHLAPAGYHLLLEHDGHFALSVDAPVLHSRPSIDVLFGSASDVYGAGLVGVLLTGANRDGAKGLLRIRQAGGIVVIQSPESAEAAAMPQAGLDLAGADHCLPLERIAALLNRLCLG